VQSAGKTTHLLNSLNSGDQILDVVGPLGKPSEIEKFRTVRGDHGDWHYGESIVQSTTPGLGTAKRGYIQADSTTQHTTRPGVFAGGDIVTGAATVILAMGAGRRAATSIHEYLTNGKW